MELRLIIIERRAMKIKFLILLEHVLESQLVWVQRALVKKCPFGCDLKCKWAFAPLRM